MPSWSPATAPQSFLFLRLELPKSDPLGLRTGCDSHVYTAALQCTPQKTSLHQSLVFPSPSLSLPLLSSRRPFHVLRCFSPPSSQFYAACFLPFVGCPRNGDHPLSVNALPLSQLHYTLSSFVIKTIQTSNPRRLIYNSAPFSPRTFRSSSSLLLISSAPTAAPVFSFRAIVKTRRTNDKSQIHRLRSPQRFRHLQIILVVLQFTLICESQDRCRRHPFLFGCITQALHHPHRSGADPELGSHLPNSTVVCFVVRIP